MKTIVKVLAVSTALILFACAKKKEAVEVEPPPPAESRAESTYQAPANQGPSQAELLEAERRRLEELMNKIMADDVYFKYDQADLTAEAKDILVEVGDILKRESRFSILTEGHTDERGTEAYNMGLGMRRADAVVNFLVSYGIAANRMTKVSYGEEQPKASGGSEEAFAQNRRAAFRVKVNN